MEAWPAGDGLVAPGGDADHPGRALGNEVAGVFGNNQILVDQVRAAAAATDEPVWQLPLRRSYREHLKSTIADIANVGPLGSPTGLEVVEPFSWELGWWVPAAPLNRPGLLALALCGLVAMLLNDFCVLPPAIMIGFVLPLLVAHLVDQTRDRTTPSQLRAERRDPQAGHGVCRSSDRGQKCHTSSVADRVRHGLHGVVEDRAPRDDREGHQRKT
ncbi:hypothetical protein [Kribbella pittospori]|uniref:hypothetical protein n=1 Tax=Kribbella pittospori TaxID=722689 RepID=UPI00192D6144|nr:hypothetical protein [Kribbella pittospori]